MKFPHALCLLPLLSLAAGPLHSQEAAPAPAAADGGDKLLRIQVEWIEVEALQMTELLREGAASDTASMRMRPGTTSASGSPLRRCSHATA